MAAPRSLDELCRDLGNRRSAAGSPSYAEIARRIGALRGGAEPAKVTVYDCFRPGRRRVDARLIGEIVRVLGVDSAEAARWQEYAGVLNGERRGAHIETTFAPRRAPGAEIGREELIASLPPAEVTLLSGLPGIGKSTLASALVPAGAVLTVDLRGSDPERPAPDPIDVLRRMLGGWGNRSLPYELARLRERVRAEAAGRVVVIEDLGSGYPVVELIVPGVRYVLTSRVDLEPIAVRLREQGFTAVHRALGPLDDGASRRLLHHMLADRDAAGAGRPDAPVEGDALDRIVAVGGGLPLDLAMLAGIVGEHRGWTFDDLASRFEQEPRDARIRPVLEAATRSLPTRDAGLLADIALLDREVDESLLVGALGKSAEKQLERLRARHLIERRDGRVQMHATVFAFAADRSRSLRPASTRRAFVERMSDALRESIADDGDYAAREAGTVLAVASAAREHGLDGAVEQLAIAAHPGLARWSMWDESLRLHDLAARGAALNLVPDIALGIAQCAEKLGRFDQALVTLHRVRRVAQGAALARTWNQIGNVQRWMSHLDDALMSYQKAIDVARTFDDRVVEGRAMGNHADTLRIVARYEEAERHYAAALEIALAAGDELNVVIVRGNRALCLLAVGRLDEAQSELHALLDASQGRSLPYVRRTMALISEARGDDIGAREWIGDALDSSRGSGEYGTEADLVLLGARIDAREGRLAQARRAAEGVLADAERAGSPLIATEAANSLAEILLSRDSLAVVDRSAVLAEAERHAREARGIAEATGDRAEVARSDGILARVACAAGHRSRALELASASDELYRRLGHRMAGGHDSAADTSV